MLRALVYIVPIGLAIYALIDLRRSEEADRMGLHPLAWAAVIVLLPVVGPLTWVLVSRSRRTGGPFATRPAPGARPPTGSRPPAPGRRPRRSGPVAPDDDPEFLWRLEQQQRRAARRETDTPQHPPTEDDGPAVAADDDPTA